MLSERESDKGKIVHLEEENALLRQRLFGRKSEQTADPATPQMALFNEAESVAEHVDEVAEEEIVAPTKRRGKRKHLPADLPRLEIIHELPEHELTCACGYSKHAITKEISEQLEIVPMQIRVICFYVGEQSVSNGRRGFQVAGLDAYAVLDEMAGRIRLNLEGGFG
jgi:hypothetical protein